MTTQHNKPSPWKGDTNLGPPKRRWRFIPTSGALILTLLAGSVVPSWGKTTEGSEIAVYQNNSTSILFDHQTIQSPDGELVFDEIDFGGCTVEGHDGTTYHDPACVEAILEKRTKAGGGFIGAVIGGMIGAIGGPIGLGIGAIVGAWVGSVIECATGNCSSETVTVQVPANKPPTVSNPEYEPSPMVGSNGNTFPEPTDVTLSWEGSDPEGDHPIKYSVFFGTDLLVDNLSSGTYTISNSNLGEKNKLEFGKSYFWMVEAEDSLGNVQKGPPWGFSIGKNNPPYMADVTFPKNNGDEKIDYSSGIVKLEWSWEGKTDDKNPNPDPDDDQVYYDVYASSNILDLVDLSISEPICENKKQEERYCEYPVEGGKTYHWRVVAKDEHYNEDHKEYSTKGYFWQFHTKSLPEAAVASFKVNFPKGVVNKSVVAEEKINFTVKFTDASSGDITSWLWDFGVPKEDGTGNQTSNEQNSSFTYKEAGIYTVKLTVTDASGNENSTEMDITVEDLESVPLMVLPGVDTMKLDWSMESINTYIPDPINTFFQIWRTESVEGQDDDWKMIKEINYMDSSISANQYFDENDAEGIPEMVKEHKYCYYFKVLNRKGSDDNLLTQSEEVCNIIGAVQIFINDVPSAAPGQNVYIPVKISNAKGLRIADGNLRLAFDTNVFVVGENPTNDLETELNAALKDFKYTIPIKPQFNDGNKGRIVDFGVETKQMFNNIKELPDKITNGGSEFFMITGKVRGDVTKGTRTQFFWEPEGSSMSHVGNTPVPDDTILSFGDATFKVKKGDRTRDSKSQPVVDGYFTVDTKGRLGDPNLNGSVTTVDGMLVLGHITDKNTYSFSDKQITAADVNGNGKVDANDAARIFYYSYHGTWPSLSSDDSQSTQDDSPMSIELGNVGGESGAETETTLNVVNLSDFTGGEFILSYDPDVIASISSVEQTTFTNDFTIFFNDNGEGKVRIAMANREPINGNGDLATIKLRLKSKTALRKRTRDGATIGKRSASLVLAQTQFFDPVGRNFVTSLQRTVERKNAEVVRTDVEEEVNGKDTGSGDDSTPNDDTTISKLPKVSGQILDKAGDPIMDVTVQVAEKSTVTDETGYWEIPELAQGEYTVTANKEGYTFVPQTFTVEDDDVVINHKTSVDSKNDATKLRSTSGYILDKDNNPIADVTVQMGDKTVVTDDTGYWEIDGINDGIHTVTASKDGYWFAPKKLAVIDADVIVEMGSNGPYSVGGVIVDELGNPIAGVEVKIGDEKITTGNVGYWEINGLREGEYTAIANKDGYTFAPTSFELGNEEFRYEVPIQPISDLKVKIMTNRQTVKQDDNITYTITVINGGSEPATGIILTDELPEGTNLVSIETLDGGECDADTVSCSLPDLTTGNFARVKLVVNNAQPNRLLNIATVTSNEYPVDVSKKWTRGIPHLSVSIADTPDPIAMAQVDVDRVVHYTLDVQLSENAPYAATNVELTMTLPKGVELKSVNSDYGMCDTSKLPTITCILTDLSVDNPDDISHATLNVDVEVKDAGLLVLTSEAKVSANEYPAHLDRERTKIFIPEDIEVDLAIVIDDTGSMQDEINGVKAAVKKFIAENDVGRNPLTALVTFKDEVKVRAFTRDMDVLEGAIKALKAEGGGTCSEASIEAINVAISHTKKGGTILFSTDASPYDDADETATIKRLRDKAIRFNAIITGDCSQKDSWNELPNDE